MNSRSLAAILVAVCVMLPQMLHAQPIDQKYEFRGGWVAAVTNLDWPVRGASTAAQQAHLIEILDGFQEAGINAVIFQVRPELDALYESDLEPWSYWLTGEQGKAPDPFYDPLAFAIEESHKRGMELHAWFNPYRAERAVDNYPLDPSHVSVRHPEWTFTVGTYRQLDPGLPEVREYVTDVVMDVVRRYDVDGIHFDDYFYPYAPHQISFEDALTFANDTRGFTSIGDWRRDNVNLLVEMLNDAIQAEKPHVKFGISPFGIWRPGNPQGIVGTDAYATIYADATAWLRDQTIDYLAPQLYWQFGGGQDFGLLAPWWAGQRNDRHMYIGIGLYKADSRSFGGSACCYAPQEVPNQIRFTRGQEGLEGTILFRSRNIVEYNSQGIADTLASDLYARPAFTPPMPWKSMEAPGTPENLVYERTGAEGENTIELTWDAPTDGEADVRFYAIYRVEADTPPDFADLSEYTENIIAVTSETHLVDTPTDARTYYFVSALSPNSIESEAIRTVFLADPMSSGDERPTSFLLGQNYPNPFNPSTTIEYSIDAPAQVRLSVFNVLGQEVALLVDGFMTTGEHTVLFEAANLPSGSYIYVLETENRRSARTMLLLK